MTIETRTRNPRTGEDKRRAHVSYRVRWRLGGGTGPKQSLTLDTLGDAQRLEVAVRDHGYPAATDPFVKSLAIIGARTAEAPRPAPLTLADALTAYAARPGIVENTRRNIKGAAARFPDTLTRANIHTLTAAEVDAALTDLAAVYAPSTMYQTRLLLTAVLTAHGRAAIAPRKVSATRTVEPRYLSREQIETLALAADKHGLGPMVRVAGQTGLRWAEIAGLEPRHIDRDRAVLMVRQQIPQKGMTEWAPGAPKSQRSRRDVPLTPATLAVIDAWLKVRDDGPALFTPPPGGHTGRGTRRNVWWSYVTFWRRWQLTLADAKLGHIRFHDLRHSAAKQMLDNDVRLDVVSMVLGHASVLVTAQIYGGIDAKSLDPVRAAFA